MILPTVNGLGDLTGTPVEPGPGWQNSLLRRMVLADRKAVKLDRAAFLQMLALRDTPEQVVADLVAMFTETGE
jgi:hypothetical protein